MNARTTCGTCAGQGWLYINDTNTSCPDCEGNGSVEYQAEWRLTNAIPGSYHVEEYRRDTDTWGNLIEWVRDSNGSPMRFTNGQWAHNHANRLNKRWNEHRAINYSADSESGDYERITPDPEGN